MDEKYKGQKNEFNFSINEFKNSLSLFNSKKEKPMD